MFNDQDANGNCKGTKSCALIKIAPKKIPAERIRGENLYEPFFM